MEIKLKTLTPIWTGGVETGQMDRLQETGLIGSLRWWYEAIVRGLGGDVCDPTTGKPEHRCQFNTKAYEINKNIKDGLIDVCPVCQMFGCTGWKRRFKLRVSSTQAAPFYLATKDKANKFNHRWLSEIYNTEKSNVAFDQLTLRFRWIRGYESQHQIMSALLSLISQLGGLGAKPQYGFGLFSYTEAQSSNQSLATIKQNLVNPNSPKNLPGNYPNIRDFWLLRCTIPQKDVDTHFSQVNVVGDKRIFAEYKSVLLPVSFDIRYKLPGSSDKGLRQAYRLQHGKMLTRQMFGTSDGGEKVKRASSVFVSHLYKENKSVVDYQLRVWGFTNTGLASEIETSLKSIFPNLDMNGKVIGSELLNGIEVNA